MRHANPRSVWTRFSCLSVLVLAVWSRVWIGWYSLIPITIALGWSFANPLLFGVPASTRNWASKAVFGERIWADRKTVSVPVQFRSRVPHLANVYSSIGMAMLVFGSIVLDVKLVVAGVVVVHGGKLWYLDRMVLLFEDMKQRHPKCASWEYGP